MLILVAALVPACAFAQQSHPHHDHGADHQVMTAPRQAGQSAFAAIQEIVEMLVADPGTDWRKVDIEALRQHLIDMDNVTLRSTVSSAPIEGGMTYSVEGEGPVQGSIRRMILAHAETMNGIEGWTMKAAQTDRGATLTVVAPERDQNKLKALGFIGVMTLGMHHQQHHLMIARGEHPHR
jgi:hypothetical protein